MSSANILASRLISIAYYAGRDNSTKVSSFGTDTDQRAKRDT